MRGDYCQFDTITPWDRGHNGEEARMQLGIWEVQLQYGTPTTDLFLFLSASARVLPGKLVEVRAHDGTAGPTVLRMFKSYEGTSSLNYDKVS